MAGDDLAAMAEELKRAVDTMLYLNRELDARDCALRLIKLTALSATSPQFGFGHIVKLCNKAGANEVHFEQLKKLELQWAAKLEEYCQIKCESVRSNIASCS